MTNSDFDQALELAAEAFTEFDRPLSEAEAQQLLQLLPTWTIPDDQECPRLIRSFSLPNFQSALDMTNAIGAISEQMDHHPVIELTWGRVDVTWWTHSLGGLHRNDFIMAARTEQFFLQNQN